MVKVVTDTASGIAPESEIAKELGITVIPMHIIFGTESYRDGLDISADEIYHRLRNKEIPTTSAPSPGEVAAIFDRLAEETDDILAVILSSGYSVTYEAVLEGKEMMKKKCRVEVIDSLQGCGGEAILAINAAKEAKEEKSLDNVSEIVHSSIPKTHMRMTFDTLEYLRRSGRIGRVPALIGSMLKINPILMTDDDGRASPCPEYGAGQKQSIGCMTLWKGLKI
jgi:DegV family protein with EDD domain